jgi:hypothetical protein
MGELDLESLTVLWVDPHSQWLANGKLSAHKIDLD